MSPPNFLQNLLLLLVVVVVLLFISTSITDASSSSSLSTIAISHIGNKTLVCALIQSPFIPNKFDLNCTSFPNGTTHYYPSGAVPYSAIAAGDGFLCALISPFSSDTSVMRWWDFAHNPHIGTVPDPKRVYIGPTLLDLSAGDSHVCGLVADSRDVCCWRWPQLSVPQGLNLGGVAVGGSFVCGLLDCGEIRCFGDGGDDAGVVGNEPLGNFTAVAAGTSHACGLSCEGEPVCWGFGAPEIPQNELPPLVISMALGDNRTCVLAMNGTVRCWGPDTELPADLVGAPFVSIQARGDTFCGVLMANYSLVCWGSERFRESHVVFKLVLPGACATQCPCGVISGTGMLCDDGASVCRACLPRPQKTSPSPSSNSTPVNDQLPGSNTRKKVMFIALGSVALFLSLIAAAAAIFYLRIRLKNGRIHNSVRLRTSIRPAREPVMESNYSQLFGKVQSHTVEEFPMKLLLAITDGFSETHKIGSGSFGSVYSATLRDGRVVAIKRAESFSSASTSRARSPYVGQNNRRHDHESAFCAELVLLSRVNHKNLVRLLGYCNEGSERVLVYEFMTNGTLHDLLHRSPDSPLGSWAARIRVALDAARGIEYLHTYAVPQIIHRDIKSSNILLDEHWTAKVSDFGLSLLNDSSSNPQLRAAGTVGYMDPEYYRLQHLTAKSDVYSFGVVLLEILSGCKVIQCYEEDGSPKNVVEFAVPHIEVDDIHQVLDARLPPPTPIEIEAVAYVAYLAVDCVHPEGRHRPSMTEIVDVLERTLAAISGQSQVSKELRL